MDMDVQVLAISTDFTPTLKHWKENELKAEFPMLSDHMRKVSEQYGILIPQMGLANRATFVVDIDGKIAISRKATRRSIRWAPRPHVAA